MAFGIFHPVSMMWYSLNSVVSQGGDQAWSSIPGHALLFADQRSAKEFISKFLRMDMHVVEVRDASV